MGKSRGFTLLELMVVLVIVTLMIALVPPLVSGLGGFTELKGASRRLAAGLRSARNQAILKQREAVLSLDLEQRHFSVTGNTRQFSLPRDVDIKLYTARSELLDESSGRIRFFPDGSSTGGHITLSNGRVEYTVNVDWLTGQVSIVNRDAH